MQRVNLGYLWHAMCLFVYMLFVVGGRLLVDIYRLGSADGVATSTATAGQAAVGLEAPVRAQRRTPLSLSPNWSISRLLSGRG